MNNITMVNYDAYATTFSNSRKNLHWWELDAIIEDMKHCEYTSVLDVGCGNGRFLEWIMNTKQPEIDDNSLLGLGGGNLSKNSSAKNNQWKEFSSGDENSNTVEQSEVEVSFSSPNSFGTFAIKSTEGGVWKIKNYLGIDNSAGMIAEARKLHPDYQFEVCPMESLSISEYLKWDSYDAIIFLASFHHLETREERIQVLKDIQKYLAPNGAIYMTNWNLREQPRYEKSHRWDGDYDIKIGEFSRYYHGFTVEELAELFETTGYQIVENRVFEWGRNILSKIISWVFSI